MNSSHSGREPVSAVRGRHPDIDDRQVRDVPANQLQQLRAVARLADHLETRPPQQASNPLADQHIVIGNHNPAPTRYRVLTSLVEPAASGT
jgi:hypothetical protein